MAAFFKRYPDLKDVAIWGVAAAAGATAFWVGQPIEYLMTALLKPWQQNRMKRILRDNNREGIYLSKVHIDLDGSIKTLEYKTIPKETESEEKQST